jgi:hypothetical protein
MGADGITPAQWTQSLAPSFAISWLTGGTFVWALLGLVGLRK